jgi:hypothetical protein
MWQSSMSSILLALATSFGQTGDDVFSRPVAYVGRAVQLCGFFHETWEDSNVWRNEAAARALEPGLGFIPAPRAKLERGKYHLKHSCVRGEIVRSGCGVDLICTWSTYPFALKELQTR